MKYESFHKENVFVLFYYTNLENLEKATFYRRPIIKLSEGTSQAAWCVWKKRNIFVTYLCYITMYIMPLKGCFQGTLLESVDYILVSLNISKNEFY